MKRSLLVRLLQSIAWFIAISSLGGCASNGYISSNITTGLGLDVSENPQTQIPHVRFGYIRNGLYYIPTGKTGNSQGSASETPHVVSKIHVSSEFAKSITIIEKFAVGDQAVASSGARQLFADTSTETQGQVVSAPLVSSGTDKVARDARYSAYLSGREAQKPKKVQPKTDSRNLPPDLPAAKAFYDGELARLVKQNGGDPNATMLKQLVSDNGLVQMVGSDSATKLFEGYKKGPDDKSREIFDAVKGKLK